MGLKVENAVNLIISKQNQKNIILLIKRSKNENIEPNKWCIPGGSVEDLETFEEGLIREIKEEVGTDILKFKYFKSYFININKLRAVYFSGEIIEKNIKINHESSEFRWFNKEEILELEIAFNQKEILIEYFNQNP